MLLVAATVLAIVFAVQERRAAFRAGRRPRTLILVLCALAGALVVIGGATLVLAGG